ncbi:MAG: TonB-dependent siderophore receptor [Pseudomonadota bacterium]
MKSDRSTRNRFRQGPALTLTAAMTMAVLSTMASAESAMEEIVVTGDSARFLANRESGSSFGFQKSLADTPRSISLISAEAIEAFGLTAVEDLVQFVPGVFTTTRFGIQGSIDVRNVSADTYFRGMKRLNLQGHARSVLAAMDSIEVVKGPPSPLYGMGKIGGYTNMTPKSGRAETGAFMPVAEGFSQLTIGHYGRQEFSAGIGGPVNVLGKPGGYYLYGLIEDSETFSESIDIGQRILQASLSIDDAVGPFRLETGVNFQRSTTMGGLTQRLTQELIDEGVYIRGTPLVNMDANGDGKIGYYEMHQTSPVRGNLSASNQPLIQRFRWPLDANGNPIALDQFQTIAGIPEAMYDYLVANPEADPTGLLRAQGVGGPTPVSGLVPAGFVMDPRTVGYDTLDFRRTGAFEKELQADLALAYFDLIYDLDPDFTVKYQLFYDSMDQFKNSEQPGGGKQDVTIAETKLTITRRLNDLPNWLALNSLASVNYRFTEATGYRYGGDFSSSRMDVMAQVDPMTPNTSFWHPFDNDNLNAGGAAWTSDYKTQFRETGIGLLFDIDLFEKTNLMLGARYDYSSANNTEFAGTFIPTTGTSANPGAFRGSAAGAEGEDEGSSWSASISHEVVEGIRPYATFAEASVALDTNNNRLANTTIQDGHIGSAKLTEFGIKGSIMEGRLYFSLAGYEQTRTSVTEEDPGSVIGAEVSSTLTEGIEAELRFSPARDLVIALYGLEQETVFSPNLGGNVVVNARTLGFQDVVDGQGNVIYPAEAFLFGGRAQLILPAGMEEYRVKQGNPQVQFGFNATYSLSSALSFTFSGNYFESVNSGRLRTVELPETTLFNAGISYNWNLWEFKLNVRNLTDERYFRARTGDTLGEIFVQSMPGRTWVATARADF